MFNRFTQFLQNLFNPRRRQNIIKQIDEKRIFDGNEDLAAIRNFATATFAEIRRTEDLITNFKNVQSIREVLGIDPRYYAVKADEQLTARLLVITPEGVVFHIEISFKTGEQWSFEREQALIKARMAQRSGVQEGFSEMVESSVVEPQWYVQKWRRI